LDFSLVIPVLRIENNPWLPGLLESLKKQSTPPNEVHLVIGDRRQGRAINYGVSQCKSQYIGTVDDDSVIDDSDLFKKILLALKEDDSIGLAGAACEIPDFASSFQKKAMTQIERRFFPTQNDTIDSDMVQHPCLIMEKKLFDNIGGEDEELIRGLDPVLRKKVRDQNKRVVIVKNTWVYHLLPDSFVNLCKMYFRNGRGSAYAQKHFPHKVLELTDGFDDGSFEEKKPFVYRCFRRLLNLCKAIFLLKIIKVSTDIAYITGVICERFSGDMNEIPQVESIESTVEELSEFKIYYHKVRLK
jgi:glycosyltransferase involved in cell wall biosynthesis